MKSSEIVGKEFPKPETESFFASDDSMNAIKLKITNLKERNKETIHNNSEIMDSNSQTVNNVKTKSVQ